MERLVAYKWPGNVRELRNVVERAMNLLVASDTLYGCTFALLSHGLTRFGVDVTFVDASNIEEIEKALRPNTKVLYPETPANPTLKINDIRKISGIAHGNNSDCLVFVHNTFCTPYLQRPKEELKKA